MNILFIGDIYGSVGRRLVAEHLQQIVSDEKIQLAIANAENAAAGFGLTPALAQDLFSMGLDVLTTGNHAWDRKEIYEYLPREPRVVRPANYPCGLPGSGVTVVRARNGVEVAVINLQGRVHMPVIDCPFHKADEVLASLDPAVKVRFVDFHAEVTSEKQAMGWHLDGRVSAVIGTHTHVPTADERVLPGGTAYLTDAGMTGPYDSVIGADKQLALRRFITGTPIRLEGAKGGPELHGAIVQVDEETGRGLAIRRYEIRQPAS
ncbi:MAG TPA: TIGR00282 family metallophosphoesterase [Bryobacteraceae bacterium]|nr:TIGR00282 family metallophosphoesterase [Bryobacteraceae bacterium]